MKYKPIVGRADKVFSRGGSSNANRFKIKKDRNDTIARYEGTDLSLHSGEYQEKDMQLSFEMLRNISLRVPPISAIIMTRVNQVGAFSSPSRYHEENLGFEITLKNKDQEITDKERRDILEIEHFISNCGFNKEKKRDNFDTFLRKIVRDSLTYDQVNIEVVRDVKGKPKAFYAVDASSIRAASESFSQKKMEEENKEVSYVQLVDGRVVTWFTDEELIFAVRNPRTDIRLQPYGLSEIELIVRQLTSYMEAEGYNMRFFQQGGMTKGILNIKEDPNGIGPQGSLESFKRQWRTQVTGQQGAWKIPVFQLPGELEFINISQTGGEMVFEKWVNYLINISCAIYSIDPAEINFPNNGGVGGKGNSLFGDDKEKYKQSKSKGLSPLLQFLENTINSYLISDFGEEYIFKFTGLKEDSEEQKNALDKARVETYMTINEVRTERGLEAIDGGDIILSPYYIQAMSLSQGSDSGQGGDFDSFLGGIEMEDDLNNDLEEDIVEEGEETEEVAKSILVIKEIS